MATQHLNNSGNATANVLLSRQEPGLLEASANEQNRRTETRIRIRVPKRYHHEPVLSRLVSQHGLTVNILAALLGVNAQDDGWFDLYLQGTNEQIRGGLLYLFELDVEVWRDSSFDDGW